MFLKVRYAKLGLHAHPLVARFDYPVAQITLSRKIVAEPLQYSI